MNFFIDATLLEGRKKIQMISLINTDLAKGMENTPNKNKKTPKQLYTVGKQIKAFCSGVKNVF